MVNVTLFRNVPAGDREKIGNSVMYDTNSYKNQ
jgi:hypothetical protein